MIKTKIPVRIISFIMVILLMMTAFTFSPFTFKASANAVIPSEFTVGETLSYTDLLEQAYIVNPVWTSFTEGGNLTFSFRGTSYTEVYDATRHFSSFTDAYAYFEGLYTDSKGNITSGFASATPVFVLAPGTYTETMTVRYNAIILGSNAGISPNGSINLSTVSPKAGWSAASRKTETILTAPIERTARKGTSSTNKLYENAAVADGITGMKVIVDGVTYNGTNYFISQSQISSAKSRTVDVTVQNSIISMNKKSTYCFYDSVASKNITNYDLKNVRVTACAMSGLFTNYAARVRIDGMYFYENSGPVCAVSGVAAAEHLFDMRNSYLYKNSANYCISINYASTAVKSTVNISNTIWYETSAAANGALRFGSPASNVSNNFEVNIKNNTFLVDGTYNTAAKTTFLCADKNFIKGRHSLNVNYNRVIGYGTLLPDLTIFSQALNSVLLYDLHDNYFAPTYSSHSDQIGVKPEHYNTEDEHYVDPCDLENLRYFIDYNLTISDTMFEATGISFYDAVDFVSIDNANRTITARLSSGTVSNPKIYFKNSSATCQFYKNSGLTTTLSSFSAPSTGGSATYYAKATLSGKTTTFTVTIYGPESEATAPIFTSNYSDPTGVVSTSAYLYDPAVASYSSGSYYTREWNGVKYRFLVGTNAFATMSDIFSKAGSSASPQILIGNGTYSAITVTQNCTIIGENFSTPAIYGVGTSSWSEGPAWTDGKSPRIAGITVSGGTDVTIMGVTLTGALTDSRSSGTNSLTFKNSAVEAPDSTVSGYRQFNFTGNAVKTAATTFTMTGVHIKSLSKDSSSKRILIGGTLPSAVTMDNVYSENSGLTQLYDCVWNSNAYGLGSAFTLRNSRIDGVTGSASLITDAMSASDYFIPATGYTVSVNLLNNVFTSTGYSGTVISLSPNIYKSVNISDNIFVNSGTNKGRVLTANYNGVAYSGDSFDFIRNRVVGFNQYINGTNYSNAIQVIDVSYNYFSEYAAGYDEAETGISPTGIARCSAYYLDYAMTKTADPVGGFGFNEKDGFAVDHDSRTVTVTVPQSTTVFDFKNGGYVTLTDATMTGIYNSTGKTAVLTGISLTGNMTSLTLKFARANSPYIFSEWTLIIEKEIPAGCGIDYITVGKGTVVLNTATGEYDLTLPDTASSTSITIVPESGADAKLSYNGTTVTTVSGVESGKTKVYTITVTNGDSSATYTLNAIRNASSGYTLDYDSYVTTAYIIDPDWAGKTSGSVTFTFRGKSYTQTYDSKRHFATFEAAHAAWLATNPDIVNDTPVFILAAGNHSDINIRYRAIILGTNAGINPNNTNVDVSSVNPGATMTQNSSWDTANESVITSTVYRTTRVNGNSDLTLEKAIQTAEASAGKSLEFFLVIDGVKFTATSGYNVFLQDVDVGSRTDSTNSITLTVNGRRNNNVYLQNFMSVDQTVHLVTAQDTTFNHNTVTVKNMRMTGFNGTALFRKYLDNIIFDSNYIEGSTMTNGLLDSLDSMNPRYDINYVFKNNFFVNNNLTPLVSYNTTALANGYYTNGKITLTNNYVYESLNWTWGYISVKGSVPALEVEVTDNLFYQLGGYNDVTMTTNIEGNAAFYTYPHTYKVTGNRFIGGESILPNLQSVSDAQLSAMKFDFNGNYFSKTYSATTDKTGIRTGYVSGPTGSTDPILSDDFSYYYDYKMTTANTDFDVTDVTIGDVSLNFTADHVKRVLKVRLTENVTDTIAFATKGTAVTKTLRLDGKTSSVTTLSYDDVYGGDDDYTLTLVKNGVTVTYDVKFIAKEAGLFAEDYEDPTGEIKNTAVLLSPDVQFMAEGEIVTRQWKDTYYKFTVGENVFHNIDAVANYLGSAGGQVLIPDIEIEGDFVIPAGVMIYGVNYDVNPNTKDGTDISSDWSKNTKWGEYGETELGTVRIPADAEGTKIGMKGITLRGRFFDIERPESDLSTSVTLENIVVEHEMLLEQLSSYNHNVYCFTFSNQNSMYGHNNTDIGVMRNIRVEKIMCHTEISAGRNRLINEYLPANFTIDGMYCDMTASGVSLFGWWKMSLYTNNTELNLINSNFRNGVDYTGGYLYFQGRDHRNNANGQTAVLNIRNNCFYNTQTSSHGFEISPFAYSEINITENLFLSSTAKTTNFITFTDLSSGIDISDILNIYRNRFVGTTAKVDYNSSMTGTLNLTGNYYSAYSASFTTGTTTTSLSGTQASSSWYYKNYALTTRSDSLGGYSFGNGMEVNYADKTLSLILGKGTTTFSLEDYITSNNGNTIAVTDQSSITALPVASSPFTVTVTKGTASESWTLTVKLTTVDMTTLYAAIKKGQSYTSTDYKDFAYERLQTALEAGIAMTHNADATAADVANAANNIYTTINVMLAIKDLEDTITSAKAVTQDDNSDETFNALQLAIGNGEVVANEPLSGETELKAAKTAIQTAINNLAPEGLDLDALLEAIANAKAEMEADYYSYYTTATRTTLETKYATAVTVSENESATQTEITDAATELNTALAALNPNKSLLTAAISDAENYTNTDSKYTALSFKALTDEITEAKALTDPTAKQIKEACEALTTATEGLVDQSAYIAVLNRVTAITNTDNKYCTPTFTALTEAIETAQAAQPDFASADDVEEARILLVAAEDALTTHVVGDYTSNNDASCKEDGTKTAYCTTTACSYSETVPDEGTKLDHVFENYVSDNNASCYKDGTKTAICENCDETDTIPETGTATGEHDWGEYVSNGDATCIHDGTKTANCQTTGCTATDTIPETGTATGEHDWGEYVSNGDATCIHDGTKTAQCKNCTATDTADDEGSATGEHVWGTYVSDGNATCYSDGTKTAKCQTTGCTEKNTVTIEGSATGRHNYSAYVSDGNATCYADGTKTSRCLNDGCTEKVTITMPGTATGRHNYSEYVSDGNASCYADGTKTSRCLNDGCTEKVTITMPGTATGRHSYGAYVSDGNATCHEDGTKTSHCQTEGCTEKVTVTDIGSATGNHVWGTYTSNNDATCHKDGTKTAKCTTDGCTSTNKVTDKGSATGKHVWGEYVYNNDATYEKDGTETAECTTTGCTATDTRTKEGSKLVKDILFVDVPKTGKWYSESVYYVARIGLVKGITETTYEPDTEMNRAMFVTILSRLEGVTVDNSKNTQFTDVPTDRYYTGAVAWAAENGIVTGTSDTTFAPMDYVTREQMCAMLVRYANYKNITLKKSVAKENFTDDNMIHNYAKEAVYACQQAGIVNGIGGGKFAPRDTANRAQVAKIFMVFHQDYVAK